MLYQLKILRSAVGEKNGKTIDVDLYHFYYWKGSSWRLGCIRYVEITLIVSSETYKKFNSTSFNLKWEVFIRRDEVLIWRGLVFIEKGFDTW